MCSGRSHKLSAQQHGPQQQHGQHRAVWSTVASSRLPTRWRRLSTRSQTSSSLCNWTPSRTPPLPHTTTCDGDPCTVPNCPRNPPVWPWRRRRPGGSDWGSPVPPSCSVCGSWSTLPSWRPLPRWQPRWISLWHTKHSQPSDGLVRLETSWPNLVNLKMKLKRLEYQRNLKRN